jgi:hypothetical protein
MTLIVEDGTGLVDAESYVSVAETDTYHLNYNNTSWALASIQNKEVALRKATQYLDSIFLWNGSIYSTSQSLSFPRVNIMDLQGRILDKTIPRSLKESTSELALIALTENLNPVTSKSDYVKRKKVGELEIEYKDGAPSNKQYNAVFNLLKGLHTGYNGGSQVSLVRC